MADISQITVGSTTYNIKDSTARSSASSASTAAASAQATANSALAAASSAQTTANSASTAATSAQTTANSALALASSASSAATSAQTSAASALAKASLAQADALAAASAAASAQVLAGDAIASSSAVSSALASHAATANAHGVTIGGLMGQPAFIAPETHTYGGSISGGYAQIGALVIVNMTVTMRNSATTAGAHNVARYLPDPQYVTALAVSARDTASPLISCRISGAGIVQFIHTETIPANAVYEVGGVYTTAVSMAAYTPNVTQDSETGDLTIT